MRTFIAVELPEKIKEEISRFEKDLEKIIPLRLVAPKNLHLTLFFLGDIAEARIFEVVEAVRAGARGINKVCCSAIKPFYLFLGRPDFFPQKGRVHGLWLKVDGQLEVLNKLCQQVAQELEKRNFKLDHKPFSAHITIGRAKKRIKRKPLDNLAIEQLSKQKFKVDSVCVFTSILKPEGPIYSKIGTIPLE